MIYLSKNPIAVQLITANYQQPNFRFEVDIRVKNDVGNDYSTLCTLKCFPDTSGYAVFDARQILATCLSPDFPAFNQAAISTCVNIIKSWKPVIKELWGDPPTVRSLSDPTPNQVLMGGLSFVDFPGNNILEQNKFLTWQPNNKIVSKDQQEFLYYNTIGKSLLNIRVHINAHFSDGSESIQHLSRPLSSEGILIIPSGYSQLQLETLFPGKTIEKYTIWLNESDDPASQSKRSEERTYQVDFDYYKQVRYFIYQNSFGSIETLRCTGNISRDNQFDKLTGKRILSAEYSPADMQYFDFDVKNRPVIKCNTGQLYRAWKDHLQEFYQSGFIYEIVGNRFIPVVLVSDKLKLSDLLDNTHADEFEYRYAHENNAYSK
jgi:hypothetical protein